MASVFNPAHAEELSYELQKERSYYSKLSSDACEGDSIAYMTLKTDAVDDDNPVAMNSLAWLYLTENCVFENQGVAYAVALQLESADAGYPIAINNYANRLMKGHGNPP